MISIIKTKNKLDLLLQGFLKKKEEGFVFRGHADCDWELKPKLFRDDEKRKPWVDYLPKKYILENWIENKDTFATLSLIFSLPFINAANYKNLHIIYKDQKIPLERLLWFYVDIMRYNYCLCKYSTKNKNYYEGNEYLKQISIHSVEDWKNYDTFMRLLQEMLYLVECRDINTNNLLNNPVILEDITAYDETRPQHYDIATSALDWTYNPFVALFFACRNLANASSSKAIIIYPSTKFSLFLYKQIGTSDNVSVILKKTCEKIINDRAKRQEGLFTWIPKARSFYLTTGNYPKLEDFSENNDFILEKYTVEINNETAIYIHEKLTQMNINDNTMGLGERVLSDYLDVC